MTELNFKGKEFVYNHHLAVPHRPLIANDKNSIGKPKLFGNLIIQGDNLHALKSLLPLYAGKIDCIFIDPPYNTGNEGWSYNDNVNAPMIKEWLASNPIGIEDNLRHDKWCAMMWPRLKLLHELLANSGSFWMTLDDNESHRGKLLLDEIFGANNFIGEVIRKTKSTTNDAKTGFNIQHETCVIYAKNKELISFSGEQKDFSRYINSDNDSNGPWISDNPSARTGDVRFPITNPYTNRVDTPPKGRCWCFSRNRFNEHVKSGRIKFKKEHKDSERGFIFKRYLSDIKSDKHLVNSLFAVDNQYMNQAATKEGIALFGESVTDYPKPLFFIQKIIEYATHKNAIILDSFAGSGTTGHAVLSANKNDGGNRKFILVEMEEKIAFEVTAERLKRVINGYYHNENHILGLGGFFSLYTLGQPIHLDKILNGISLPEFEAIAAVLFYMATNQILDITSINADNFYVGKTTSVHVWMIYRPNLEWLKSDEAALTLNLARDIQDTDKNIEHLVFAPSRFVSQKVLNNEGLNINYVPFPDSLYQVVRG